MENKEYWICPWCKSFINVNTNKCWKCDFVSDDISKFKYNPNNKNFVIIAIVTAIIASLCCIITIITINNNEKELHSKNEKELQSLL